MDIVKSKRRKRVLCHTGREEKKAASPKELCME